MEAPPAAALVVSEPEFLLEFLVVALDAPTQLRKIDQALERDLLGQGGKPILGGLILPFRPLDQKPFFRAWLAQPVIAMRRTHPQAREAGRVSIGRALAPPDLSSCLLRPAQRERLDRGRPVLPITADQLGRPAPARPGLGRRRARAWSPYRRVIRNSPDLFIYTALGHQWKVVWVRMVSGWSMRARHRRARAWSRSASEAKFWLAMASSTSGQRCSAGCNSGE